MNEQELVGRAVRHRKLHIRGVIQSVNNNIMVINFGDETKKMMYPTAFSTVLEFEDEDVQEVLETKGTIAYFDQFKNTYTRAIGNEIQYLKQEGGKHYHAVDGENILSREGMFMYAFDTDTDLHFPDGTPIKLWMDDEVLKASVVSCEEFTIVIQTKDYLGAKVENIEFSAEQWQLLDLMKERIDEMTVDENSIAFELACKGKANMDEKFAISTGQDTAINHALEHPITFIWGPPGTGKTETLANIAIESMQSGMRVLMVSYSNVSVDGALLRVDKKSSMTAGQIIRYGYPRMEEVLTSKSLTSYQYVLSQNLELAAEFNELTSEKKNLKKKDPRRVTINERLKKIRKILVEKEYDVVQHAAFVATTVSKAILDSAIYCQNFDVVIFDEASMAYIPQVVFASGLAKKRFICLGDFRQLPSIVQNPEDTLLGQDIFLYTGITNAVEMGVGHKWLVMLDEQFRMHPEIANFVAGKMYGGLLKSGSGMSSERQIIADCSPLAEEPMGFVDLSETYSVCIKTMDASRINLLSAFISVRFAEIYSREYGVGLISPYSAQARLMLAMVRDIQEKSNRMKNVSCSTVHQFQGSEKPIIIYDAVDCFRMPYPGTLLTKTKDDTANRLFNVALTRAQGKFVLVANFDYMQRKNLSKKLLFAQFLNELERNDIFLDGEEIIKESNTAHAKDDRILITERDESWGNFLEDIRNAKREIHIDIPGLLEEDEDAINDLAFVLAEKEKEGVVIAIRKETETSIPKVLWKYVKEARYVAMPVTIIDKKLIWYGQPLCAADFISEGDVLMTGYYLAVRFEGRYTARSLYAFLGI